MSVWEPRGKPQKRKAGYAANRNKRNKKFKAKLVNPTGGLRRYIDDCNDLEQKANLRLAQEAMIAQEERDAAEVEDLERCVLSRYDEEV